MQTTVVSDSITFAYIDSGPPPGKEDYLTVIMLHGHTFHSGTFRLMVDAANALGYRAIVPNRRLYPGSTPYTQEEFDALQPSGPTDGFVRTLERQGVYLLEFCDNVIREKGLKKVALVGWSLGSLFLMMTVGAIARAPEGMRKRLRGCVKGIISLDPAALVHGFPHPAGEAAHWGVPLLYDDVPSEKRVAEFVRWVTGYCPHPDLKSRDFGTLLCAPAPDAQRARTLHDASPEELAEMADFSAADKGETAIGERVHWAATSRLTERILFNTEIRDAWDGARFGAIYGSMSPSLFVWCAWQMEDMAKRNGVQYTVKELPGANHFPMIDDIAALFEAIDLCVQG